MTTEAEREGRRTAIALVKFQVTGNRPAALALMSNTPQEAKGETLSALLALAGELANVAVIGTKVTAEEVLDRLALEAAGEP